MRATYIYRIHDLRASHRQYTLTMTLTAGSSEEGLSNLSLEKQDVDERRIRQFVRPRAIQWKHKHERVGKLFIRQSASISGIMLLGNWLYHFPFGTPSDLR